MVTQPTFLLADLDKETAESRKAEAEKHQKHLWKACWDWDGPEAGKHCDIDSCVVRKENGETVYAYMEQAKLIEERPDGTWLAVIDMGVDNWWGSENPFTWPHDGTRVILEIGDIWPPTRILRGNDQ